MRDLFAVAERLRDVFPAFFFFWLFCFFHFVPLPIPVIAMGNIKDYNFHLKFMHKHMYGLRTHAHRIGKRKLQFIQLGNGSAVYRNAYRLRRLTWAYICQKFNRGLSDSGLLCLLGGDAKSETQECFEVFWTDDHGACVCLPQRVCVCVLRLKSHNKNSNRASSLSAASAEVKSETEMRFDWEKRKKRDNENYSRMCRLQQCLSVSACRRWWAYEFMNFPHKHARTLTPLELNGVRATFTCIKLMQDPRKHKIINYDFWQVCVCVLRAVCCTGCVRCTCCGTLTLCQMEMSSTHFLFMRAYDGACKLLWPHYYTYLIFRIQAAVFSNIKPSISRYHCRCSRQGNQLGPSILCFSGHGEFNKIPEKRIYIDTYPLGF